MLSLSCAISEYEHVRALETGRVKAEGINLNFVRLPVEEIFYRAIRFNEFDLSEMSMGRYVAMVSEGTNAFVAIPVFPSRALPLTMHNRKGAVTLLEQNGLLGSDFLLVHPQALTDEEIQLLVKRNVKVSCAPVLENTRGINGPRGPIQFSELIDADVQWSLSVDEVATNGRADFFGVMREMLRSGWQRIGDHTRVPPRRMLEFATIEGAKALGISDQVGSLVPGKRADMTLIRKTDVNMTPTIGDPSMMLVFSAQPNNVDTVIVDGRQLVRNGQLMAMNLAEICAAALESTRALHSRDVGTTKGTTSPS